MLCARVKMMREMRKLNGSMTGHQNVAGSARQYPAPRGRGRMKMFQCLRDLQQFLGRKIRIQAKQVLMGTVPRAKRQARAKPKAKVKVHVSNAVDPTWLRTVRTDPIKAKGRAKATRAAKPIAPAIMAAEREKRHENHHKTSP